MGSTSSVKSVEVTRPPIITIASGRSISVPCSRRTQQRQQAERRGAGGHQLRSDAADAGFAHRIGEGWPSCSSPRVCVTSTRLFCTAMPNRPIRPTSDETFQVSPATSSATNAADERDRDRGQDQHGLDRRPERDEEQDEHAKERRANGERQRA